jgi:hypothetical protein
VCKQTQTTNNKEERKENWEPLSSNLFSKKNMRSFHHSPPLSLSPVGSWQMEETSNKAERNAKALAWKRALLASCPS